MTNTASNFDFLSIWQGIAEIQERAKKAEANVYSDARVSCFYARNCLELLVEKVFDIDERLIRPRHDATLMSLIHDRGFKDNLKYSLFPKLKGIIQMGNQAAHATAPAQRDALQAVKELHHVLYWFARTYTPGLDRSTFGPFTFDEALVPQTVAIDAKIALTTAKQIKELKEKVAAQDEAARDAEQKRLKESADLRAENEQLKQQVAQAVQAAALTQDKHDYKESETRHWLIDPLLREAGWLLDKERDQHYKITGMPISKRNPQGNGEVDYVLWGDDGTALAVVEAKCTTTSPELGQTQAKLYADCLEKECGVRPIIFYSNGYETRLWDDTYYPPRTVQGFYTKDELALMIKRREERKHFFAPGQPSIGSLINNDITNRHYQKSAITAIVEHFEVDHARKALLVMATGTGKTRTVISLVDLLTQNNWVKNVLFMADRNALLTQAKKNFVHLLPRISCTILDSNLKKGRVDSRLYFSTYPTMKNLLDRPAETRPFGVGHFDLVVVDEAHRSVYAKYRQIFEYFDGLLVGLTATPKDEVDKNTYDIFDLQDGMPTYAYEDTSAYAEKFLVPPTKISVATKFIREGVKYKDLSEDEKAEWESKEELAEREEVLPSELNTFLFNEHTAELMFSQLLSKDEHGGIHVEGGDVIGKTIIFAANNDHAEFLQKVFDKNYPKWKGKLTQVVTYKNPYAQSLIDEFSAAGPDGVPLPFDPNNPKMRIAISVDMLDTGIDVPEVTNLVFFKVVQSKVKFTQMMGRGTRLCPNLFGPGEDKTTFKVFDYCQNFEFFDANPEGAVAGLAKPISQQLFEKRILLTKMIDSACQQEPPIEKAQKEALLGLRGYTLDMLHHQVQGMNLDNFIVRPKRKQVEPFLKRDAWENIDDAKHTELETHISRLPTDAEPFNGDEQTNNLSNRFDNQILTMQLALLERGMVPEAIRIKVMEFAQQLEGKTSIPAVKQHLQLIQDLQTLEFWEHIQVPTLEEVRRKLRNLMFALDKEQKEVVYTDFKDDVMGVRDVTGVYETAPLELTQYRKKTELYIKEHQDHLTIQKLKRNKPITQTDLDTLEALLIEASGVTDKEIYREKVLEQKPLGTFIRELVGLDMNAAKEAFSDFLDEAAYNTQQIQFINQIINYLMSNGILEVKQIFEPPFTDMHDESAYGFFEEDKVVELFGRIKAIRANADVGGMAS